MFRSRPGTTVTWLLLSLLAGTTVARADSSAAPTAIKDLAWAQVLGQTLFWDTVEVLYTAPPDSGASDGAAVQLTQALLAQRSLERYRWLIERAFDDSLWDGPDDSRVRQNFALIWRLSTRLYESTLQSRPARLYVCRPNSEDDGFACSDEADPAVLIPIPSQGPALIAPNQATIG